MSVRSKVDNAAYPIFILEDISEEPIFNKSIDIDRYSQIVVVCDENTVVHCLPKFEKAANFPQGHEVVVLPSGDQHKKLANIEKGWQALFDLNIDRNALIINLGGGVVGDMGGFIAATYKRGLHYVQIPTSLLAMVDASAGGKTGFNYANIKNSIGAFYNPMAVIIAMNFLDTLPEREIKSGFAEVLKHFFISNHPGLGKWIQEQHYGDMNWLDVIDASVLVKKEIVEQDFTEQGRRKVLNFGHTIGHAIESLSMEWDNPLRHGEAIAAGMIMEAYISYQQEWLSEDQFQFIEFIIDRYFERIDLSTTTIEELEPLLMQDKKNNYGKMKMVLLQKIGEPIIDQTVVIEEVLVALKAYMK